VTVALLTGYPPFGEPLNEAHSAERTRECDLARLAEELDWNNTGHRAKDFVSRLLVLDETKRMNVKQALRHDWFTNPAHRQDFEALYKRSVRDWQPRTHKGPVIVDFRGFTGSKGVEQSQTSEHVSSVESSRELYPGDASGVSEQNSKLSNTTSDGLSLSPGHLLPRRHREMSPTLSDPALPPYSRAKSGQGSAAGQCSPLSPQAAQDTMDCDVNTAEMLSRVQFLSDSDPSMNITQYSNSPMDEGDDEARDQNETMPSRHPEQAHAGFQSVRGPDLQLGQRQKTRKSIWDDFEGEVYEEMDNMITGRGEHFTYGAGQWM
jgi:serine/threonine protein kinase